MSLLLDTCACLWLANGDTLSKPALQAINAASQHKQALYVSPMTAWEIGTLYYKKKISLNAEPRIWFEQFIKLPGILLAELNPDILILSTHLERNLLGDPADRILLATAQMMELKLLTRDKKLLQACKKLKINHLKC